MFDWEGFESAVQLVRIHPPLVNCQSDSSPPNGIPKLVPHFTFLTLAIFSMLIWTFRIWRVIRSDLSAASKLPATRVEGQKSTDTWSWWGDGRCESLIYRELGNDVMHAAWVYRSLESLEVPRRPGIELFVWMFVKVDEWQVWDGVNVVHVPRWIASFLYDRDYAFSIVFGSCMGTGNAKILKSEP